MKTKLNRRGAIAAVTAVVMIPVVGFAGLAIDLTRIWMVSARLKTSVDAASLIAARTITSTTRDDDTRALFWANFTQNGRTPGYLGSVIANPATQPVIEPVPNSTTRIRVTAAASLRTTLFGVIDEHTMGLWETTVAERGGTGIELAIVLDQTASMSAASGIAGKTKLQAAQDAVGSLLTQIYGQTADTANNVFVSVVPFARTINIGTGNFGFLDEANAPSGWTRTNWSGCVEARRYGQDITEAAPTTTTTRLRPYYFPDTYRRVGWASAHTASGNTNPPSNAVVTLARNASAWRAATLGTHGTPGTGANVNGAVNPYEGAGACTVANNDSIAYPTITVNMYATANATTTTPYTVRFCHGDNDYGNANLSATTTDDNYNESYANLRNALMNVRGLLPTAAAGPNMLCAMSPIMPLNESRSAVMTAVRAITAPTRSGGTTIATGMQGAWYTLSPNWRGLWPGTSTSADFGALPLAYGTRNMFKAVVMLTDGDNNWQCAYSAAPNSTSSACLTSPVRSAPPTGGPADNGVDMLYGPYGRAEDWNTYSGSPLTFTTSPTQVRADTLLDSRFTEICRAMKGSNYASTTPSDHNIRIYIIGFEVGAPTAGSAAAVRSMLQACASQPAFPYYIEVQNSAALDAAFTEVGNALSSLRMIE